MTVHTHTHTHLTALCPGLPRVSQYQKGKTNLDFTEARDSEWQWNPLGHMQVCNSFQTDNHASTPLLTFLQAGCPSCRPTNSVKALRAIRLPVTILNCIFKTCTGWHWINRTIQPFNQVYKNLHKITPSTLVAHRQIRRQKWNVYLNILW